MSYAKLLQYPDSGKTRKFKPLGRVVPSTVHSIVAKVNSLVEVHSLVATEEREAVASSFPSSVHSLVAVLSLVTVSVKDPELK